MLIIVALTYYRIHPDVMFAVLFCGHNFNRTDDKIFSDGEKEKTKVKDQVWIDNNEKILENWFAENLFEKD